MRVLTYQISPNWEGIKAVLFIVLVLVSITGIGYVASEITGEDDFEYASKFDSNAQAVETDSVALDGPIGYFLFGVSIVLILALVVVIGFVALLLLLFLAHVVADIEKVDDNTETNEQ